MGGLQVLTLCLLVCFVAGKVKDGGKDQHIIGGVESEKGRWPFMAALERGIPGYPGTYELVCGATLISETHVLTSARCFDFMNDAEEFRLKFGLHQFSANDEEATIYAQKVTKHPDYNYAYDEPDLAIIELASPADITNDYISIVRLANEGDDFVGNPNCYITGWGQTDPENFAETSDVLMEVHSEVHSTAACVIAYEAAGYGNMAGYLSEAHTCAAGPNTASCFADTGGPLHCDITGSGDYVQVGIASWDFPFSCLGVPSVYTTVGSYLDWIKEQVPDLP